MFTIFYSFFFCFLPPHLSSRSCNAPVVSSSLTLVGSRCAGLENTPTSVVLCSRGGILWGHLDVPGIISTEHLVFAPPFFWSTTTLSVAKSFPVEQMIMFHCFVCAQPWLCHVTSHFNPHWLSCQQYI